jgi:putative nucleotidyltransferase with HDIG domain
MSFMKIDITQIKLPAMPMVAQKIICLDMKNDRDQDSLVPVICQCPVTSARIISMANSVALGASGGAVISSVKEAVQRIGITNAYNSALASALFTLKNESGTHEFDSNKIWKHSAEIRQVMQALAKLLRPAERPSPQDIALVALLHDIGFLAYSAIDPELTDTLLERISKGDDSDAVSEELFGISHDKLGAALLSSWGIPEKIVTVVRWHHHKFYDYPYNETYVLCNLLIIADAALMYSANNYDPHLEVMTLEKAVSLLHIDGVDLQMTIKSLKAEGLTVFL